MTDVPIETSLLRTYRYVRIGIAATVLVIAVSVGFGVAEVGLLESISAYYYSPARNAIVGALIAASFGLFALSGRGVERNLLDAAALLAPIIAIVPTPIYPGGIPGFGGTCPADAPCVPLEVRADVDNNVATFLVTGAVLVVVALFIRSRQGLTWRQIAASVFVTVLVLISVGLTWAFAREAFLALGHFVATSLFFLVIAAVAVWNAFPHAGDPLWVQPSRALAVANIAIAAALVADIVVIVALVAGGEIPDAEIPPVFVCEFVALGLFALFWILQSAQKWRDPDPSLVGTLPPV
ncbi:hypothetical protein [Microbacterium sp. BK668]|uniref:hypothetical protein n=1 Tax=Microbacterium sp. BK668 TaxID=2512118 RepID=UPI00105CE676|nr:hypothetical protein [Microbacterium sp. BK668]TDN91939.1 hypothetical protein EV279_1448 [Microbacterium sp. BK668]